MNSKIIINDQIPINTTVVEIQMFYIRNTIIAVNLDCLLARFRFIKTHYFHMPEAWFKQKMHQVHYLTYQRRDRVKISIHIQYGCYIYIILKQSVGIIAESSWADA